MADRGSRTQPGVYRRHVLMGNPEPFADADAEQEIHGEPPQDVLPSGLRMSSARLRLPRGFSIHLQLASLRGLHPGIPNRPPSRASPHI